MACPLPKLETCLTNLLVLTCRILLKKYTKKKQEVLWIKMEAKEFKCRDLNPKDITRI